jgi:outer membrane protein W
LQPKQEESENLKKRVGDINLQIIMKKIFNLIAAALISVSASAQSETGSITIQPNVGMTVASATSDAGQGSKCAVGLTAGVEGMYMFTDKFGATLGVSLTGYNISGKEGPEKGKISSNYYICVPVMADYYVAPGLALKAGVSVNFLATSKFDGENKVDGEKYRNLFKRGFISIPVGASYEINGFVFDARYNIGVRKIMRATEIKGTYNAFSFTVGYKF